MIQFNPNVNTNLVKISLIEREGLMHTGIGNGIALPHTRNPVVTKPEEELISICMLEKEVNYDALDKIPVHTAIFVISANPKSHLEMISKVAKLCADKEFVEMLKQKKSEEEIFNHLKNI
ncbi:MAG TPA: PTS sugar transporter subunit IIA [Spirochaetota bacterium]|nr:PTS sugar transporter subunit IIA [Spirochaetota bacterium]